jgi:hypothetical protein
LRKLTNYNYRRFADFAKGSRDMNIAVETHAPSQQVLLVGMFAALAALWCYSLGDGYTDVAFSLMALAWVVSTLGAVATDSAQYRVERVG